MTFTAVDINECEEDKQCSHKCVNTPGGYTCACNSGYYLSADEHTCFGKLYESIIALCGNIITSQKYSK